MTTRKIRRLIKKFNDGVSSDEETRWVEEWLEFRATQKPTLNWKEAHWKSFKAGLMKNLFSPEIPSSVERDKVKLGHLPFNAWYKIAAVIILIISSTLLLLRYGHPTGPLGRPIVWKTLTSPRGAITRLVLDDSTEMWVNAGSVVRYPDHFSEKMREVRLEQGGAFFYVKHNPKRGFIVRSPYFTAQVLGTSFDINAYPRAINTSIEVATGKVYVTPNNHKTRGFFLVNHQRAMMDKKNGRITQEKITDEATVGWTGGVLRFYNEPFKDIITALENRFDIVVDFKHLSRQHDLLTIHASQDEPVGKILEDLCLVDHTRLKKVGENHYLVL